MGVGGNGREGVGGSRGGGGGAGTESQLRTKRAFVSHPLFAWVSRKLWVLTVLILYDFVCLIYCEGYNVRVNDYILVVKPVITIAKISSFLLGKGLHLC